MTETEFVPFRERLIRDYAADQVEAGKWPADDALRMAEDEHWVLLPLGVETSDHYLRAIVDDSGAAVGNLWYAVRRDRGQPEAFLYELLVFESFRRRGYGEAALKRYHTEVKALGIDLVGLHVFGHNPGAQALYLKLGYQTVDIVMRKQLDDEET